MSRLIKVVAKCGVHYLNPKHIVRVSPSYSPTSFMLRATGSTGEEQSSIEIVTSEVEGRYWNFAGDLSNKKYTIGPFPSSENAELWLASKFPHLTE